MDNSQSILIAGSAVIVPRQAAYVKLPSDLVLNRVDKMFPSFKESVDADYIKGGGHRWKGGHDLLVDVPLTLKEHGPGRALHHTAHIILTDLPTKAGIPIPGLSSEGLGPWLINHGIQKGYLSIHWADGALGILAIAEGSSDLLQATNGTLTMDGGVFFDTFIEGGVEIALALAAKNAWKLGAFNPAFAVAGGVENIIAGVISVYQTVSIYVDPLVFLGSAGTSALLGFGLAYGVAGETLGESSINAIRGGAIGGLFSLSASFGYGALAGLIAYKLGEQLAKAHDVQLSATLQIDEAAYQMLLGELCKGNVHLKDFLDRAEFNIVLTDQATTLSAEHLDISGKVRFLSEDCLQLDTQSAVLSYNRPQLKSNVQTLPEDNPILTDWYRTVFAA